MINPEAYAVLDDLLQEAGGLWLVVTLRPGGPRFMSNTWTAAVCTSEEAAQDFVRRCEASRETYAQLVSALERVSTEGRHDEVDVFLDCPDHLVNTSDIFNVRWSIQRARVAIGNGTFLTHESPHRNPYASGEYIYVSSGVEEVSSDRMEAFGLSTWLTGWIGVVSVTLKSSGEPFDLHRRFDDKILADRWVAAVRASLEGADPIAAALAAGGL